MDGRIESRFTLWYVQGAGEERRERVPWSNPATLHQLESIVGGCCVCTLRYSPRIPSYGSEAERRAVGTIEQRLPLQHA